MSNEREPGGFKLHVNDGTIEGIERDPDTLSLYVENNECDSGARLTRDEARRLGRALIEWSAS